VADGYDSIYEAYLRGVLLSRDMRALFACREGGALLAQRALSGQIVHRCERCGHTIKQDPSEYRSMIAKHGTTPIGIDCPLITMSRRRR
jgi:uncharacterized paraquat-inducible protein A